VRDRHPVPDARRHHGLALEDFAQDLPLRVHVVCRTQRSCTELLDGGSLSRALSSSEIASSFSSSDRCIGSPAGPGLLSGVAGAGRGQL